MFEIDTSYKLTGSLIPLKVQDPTDSIKNGSTLATQLIILELYGKQQRMDKIEHKSYLVYTAVVNKICPPAAHCKMRRPSDKAGPEYVGQLCVNNNKYTFAYYMITFLVASSDCNDGEPK